MKVEWTAPALRRLEEIGDYVARHDPRAAKTLVERLRSAVERLATTPLRGRSGSRPGTRELSVPRTRYIVVYTVEDDRIEVVSVFHERQNRATSFLREN